MSTSPEQSRGQAQTSRAIATWLVKTTVALLPGATALPISARLPVALAGLTLLLAACTTMPVTPPPPPPTAPPTAPLASPIPPLAPTSSPAPTPAEEPLVEPFKIVGYMPDWAGTSRSPQYDRLTHVIYAFLVPNADGTVVEPKNRPKLEKIVELAHEQGVKVLIALGGWGYDTQFEELAADPAARARFVAEVVRFVDQYNLDGADMDWEYPDPDPSPNDSAQSFSDLMRELSAALRPQGKLLTMAVPALGPHTEGYRPEVFAFVDFVNIMAYDGPGEHHSPYSYAESALDYWLGRGLPRAKAILGVPFYARPTEASYKKLVQVDATAPYTDCIEHLERQVCYNGIPTMQEKTRLALRRGGGIMIWALPYDTDDETSLLQAICEAAYGE
jgi:GH18 family chitinase